MTQFNRLRIGQAGSPEDTTGRPSQDNNQAGTYAYPSVQGVPTTQQYVYNVVPLTKNAANIAALQTTSGAANLTLTAGTGATSDTVQGNTVIKLDCARCVAIVGQGGTTQRSYTITGYDDYQNVMTQTLTGPNGAQTINTTKAFRYIQTIAISGSTGSAISVGTSDILGLPMSVPYYEACDMVWNGSQIAVNTNFVAADATSPAAATTGDVRGTINLGAISATDGIKRLVTAIYLLDVTTVTKAWGVPQV